MKYIILALLFGYLGMAFGWFLCAMAAHAAEADHCRECDLARAIRAQLREDCSQGDAP